MAASSTEMAMADIGVILGSAFTGAELQHLDPVTFDTPFGLKRLYRMERPGGAGWVSYRHGWPYSRLPHQVNYRAEIAAMQQAGVRSLLVTSSVGVLDHDLPLFEPMLVSDVLMLDNRLPDGSACTTFPKPSVHGGHLVLDEGVFSGALGEQVTGLAKRLGCPIAGEPVFGYQVGPRVKTQAENRMWRLLGAQVSSMTLAPEAVLACELGIASSGLVVGHKYSGQGASRLSDEEVAHSLVRSREVCRTLVLAFLAEAQAVPSRNHMVRLR